MTREQYEMRKHQERRRAFMDAIEPILRLKTHVACIAMPSITIYPDGRVDTVYPAWAQEHFDTCDGLIADVARSFGDKGSQA